MTVVDTTVPPQGMCEGAVYLKSHPKSIKDNLVLLS